MRKRTIGILLIVLVALLPTWYAAAQPVEHAEEVGIDTEETDMRPLQSIVDTPEAFTPAQVGVVIWLALGVLIGVLVAFHRFMDHMVRPSGGPDTMTDGGAHGWFQTDHRWIAEYIGPAESAYKRLRRPTFRAHMSRSSVAVSWFSTYSVPAGPRSHLFCS